MEKITYLAFVSFMVQETIEVTIDLGSYKTLARAKVALECHKENELFSHTLTYYRALQIDHQVLVYASKLVKEM